MGFMPKPGTGRAEAEPARTYKEIVPVFLFVAEGTKLRKKERERKRDRERERERERKRERKRKRERERERASEPARALERDRTSSAGLTGQQSAFNHASQPLVPVLVLLFVLDLAGDKRRFPLCE